MANWGKILHPNSQKITEKTLIFFSCRTSMKKMSARQTQRAIWVTKENSLDTDTWVDTSTA
jgi:hypothetical protein